MGQELACVCRHAGKVSEGTAHLESDHVLFRGDFRLRIDLAAAEAFAAGGTLTLTWGVESAELDLGPAAEKWAAKIARPKSRLDKLNVKAGHRVGIQGVFDKGFLVELSLAGASLCPVSGAKAFDLIFFSLKSVNDFDRLTALREKIEEDGAIWTVYPKGTGRFPDAVVFEKGRASGLKDNKVMSFSPTHTALRWVIPVAERSKAIRAAARRAKPAAT
ncbi:MAG: hypothetical protein SFV54_05715 [Bryobacteraceae bacterium]|nr:hypothetical protein [Bryobacteraceae bacterium]